MRGEEGGGGEGAIREKTAARDVIHVNLVVTRQVGNMENVFWLEQPERFKSELFRVEKHIV